MGLIPALEACEVQVWCTRVDEASVGYAEVAVGVLGSTGDNGAEFSMLNQRVVREQKL